MRTNEEKFITVIQKNTFYFFNPDFEQRIINGSELNAPDFTTLYTPGGKGYTDYPVLFN